VVATVADRKLDVPTLVVEDPLEAMQRLARWTLLREDAPSPTVVGITGTVGKTTTKDALATVLRHAGKRVSATAGNFNNEIGLPLTCWPPTRAPRSWFLRWGPPTPGTSSTCAA
jgi:UDP-N-acetylmuramoyl-tripeptide--D-alanyl-D-alanine ligase